MENDDYIKGDIKGKEKEDSVQGVKNSMLRISKEWVAGELERIPEGEISSLDTLDPEESRGNEIRPEVSFSKEVSSAEQVVEEEERRKEKGQNSKEISRSDPSQFIFFFVCHRN
jgi:hypothetical protein